MSSSPRSLALAAAGALALAASPASGEPPIQTLTLEHAVALALAHNPDSLSADQDVDAAEGGVTQAGAHSNPSLFVGALGNNLSPFDVPLPNQIGVTWTIPIGGHRAPAIAAARADLAGAQATRSQARRELALQVQATFVAVLLDAAALDFARQDQAGLREAAGLNEVRYKDGKIAYNEVLKLRIQAHGADDTVRQDELTLATDRAELERLVGEGVLAPDFTIEGVLAPPPPAELPAADQLFAQALAHRHDYRALQAGEDSATAAVTAARRTPRPDLDVLLDYNRIPGQAGSIDLSLSVSVPLFDRNQGAIRQADAARQKARLATESLHAQIKANVTKVVGAWQTSQARLQLYDQELLSAAKESLDISLHAYQQGRGSLLDYLDAEASYRGVESAYLSAVGDAVLAAAQLRYVVGEDLP